MQLLGNRLEALCADAKQELILVAPFMKVNTLRRLLSRVSHHINVKCVTRWRPDEIAAGVSDLNVWTLLKERPNTSLWLRSDLHAKYYRADARCLIGSANLTDTALGWSPHPNLELLLPISQNQAEIVEFEPTLLRGCISVDEELFTFVKHAVEQIPSRSTFVPPLIIDNDAEERESIPPEQWLPSLRHPENLYTAYCGQWDRLTSTSTTAAIADLAAFELPLGLSKAEFEAYIGVLLLQKPIIRQVDEFVSTPQRFGAVRDLLNHLPCSMQEEFSSDESWQTLMRWMLFFVTNRYQMSVANFSEIFVRITSPFAAV
jgi:hypothetical protein